MEEDPTFLRSPDDNEASLDDIRNRTLEKALKVGEIIPDTGIDFRTVNNSTSMLIKQSNQEFTLKGILLKKSLVYIYSGQSCQVSWDSMTGQFR